MYRGALQSGVRTHNLCGTPSTPTSNSQIFKSATSTQFLYTIRNCESAGRIRHSICDTLLAQSRATQRTLNSEAILKECKPYGSNLRPNPSLSFQKPLIHDCFTANEGLWIIIEHVAQSFIKCWYSIYLHHFEFEYDSTPALILFSQPMLSSSMWLRLQVTLQPIPLQSTITTLDLCFLHHSSMSTFRIQIH